MLNLSVRKFRKISTSASFIVTDPQRFTKMLLLAIGFHVYLLLAWDVAKRSTPPTDKIMATMLDVTLLPETKAQSVDVAVQKFEEENLIQQQHQSEPITEGPSLFTQSMRQDSKSVSKETYTRKRSISAAMHKSQDADYLARWQSYVEQYGNDHYPDIALKNNLKGDLRLLVAVNKDGSIHEVKIRKSSGSSVLDEAAIKLVYQAAPYEPLPAEISQDVDILEIIRTWQFRGTLSTS